MTTKVTKLSRHIGAIVEGIDLGKPLTDQQIADVKDALYENSVIFFRDQDITEERQIEFTKELGPIVETAHKLVHDVINSADIPPFVDEWHTDVSNTVCPPAVAILQGRTIPEFGGDTMWVSMRAIWQGLSSTMQNILRNLTVEHGLQGHVLRDFIRGHEKSAEELLAEYHAYHPMVRTHPVTGEEMVFLSERFTLQIADMHPGESKALLDYLHGLMDDPNYQVRWRWRPYDIAMWDEAATNHRALSDHYPQYRLMRRTTVGADEVPYYRPLRERARLSA